MSIKSLLLIVAATTAGVFGLASGALAGEGGAAAGAAFTISPSQPLYLKDLGASSYIPGNVTGVAVSAAVGKQDAAAAAYNTNTGNSAYALGSAGTISFSNLNSSTNGAGIASTADTNLNAIQANTFTVNVNAVGSPTVQLGN